MPACWAKCRTWKCAVTITCAPTATRPCQAVPRFPCNYEMWTGPASPCRPYDRIAPHPARWRTFSELRQWHHGRRCASICSIPYARSAIGLAQTHQLHRRHLCAERRQIQYCRHANRHFRIRRPQLHLATPHLGHARRSQIPLGLHAIRRKRDPESSTMSYDFTPQGQRRAHPQRCRVRKENTRKM